jgi:hypothetical protein
VSTSLPNHLSPPEAKEKTDICNDL